ncbi:MAG: PAS domain-containing protein [Desulfovibrio sp.]|nr:PAS domain-containing protein [Desulfovibrio sp.]
MEIAEYDRDRSWLITMLLTLVVIGVSLLISIWQTMNHQREAEEHHLLLSTRAVFLAVESSLRRGPVRAEENRLTARTEELFTHLQEDGDVLFVGIIDSRGERLLTSAIRGDAPTDLPGSLVEALFAEGEWHGRLTTARHTAYVYARKLAPARPQRLLKDEAGEKDPVFLVVGVDMEQRLGSYGGFRKNILFQVAYILAAAVFIWILGLNLLARREQARKAAALERFQAKLLDNLPDGLITLNPSRNIQAVNPAALEILGYAPGTLAGRPATDLPEEIGRCLSRADKAAFPAASAWQRASVKGKDLEVLVLPLADDKDNAYLLILRDRTRLRRLEKNLADAEKLAAIGSLAAGVAHEVRNPLSSLRGFAQYFGKRFKGHREEEEYAAAMVREADRLNRVITDLLFLARPKSLAPRMLLLEPVVREVISLLRFDLEQRGLNADTRLEAGEVYADEDALKQALINLVLNSLEALARTDGGDFCREPPLVLASGKTPEGVWIEVRDLGCGMTEEQQAQAFEAFFTARAHGTGLGLALVQRTMLDHGGTAGIVSSPGKGCVVSLFFPSPRIAQEEPVLERTLGLPPALRAERDFPFPPQTPLEKPSPGQPRSRP